jgi:hypothetical protein
MGNCLVTKLKGVVDNDNLPIFDTIRLKNVVAGTDGRNRAVFRMSVAQNTSCNLSVDGGNFISSADNSIIGPTLVVTNSNIDDPTYVCIRPTGQNCTVKIKNKANITSLIFNINANLSNNYDIDVSDLYGCLKLETLEFGIGDNPARTTIYGTFKLLPDIKLKKLNCANVQNISGTLSDIVVDKSDIEWISTYNSVGITSKIQDFVSAEKLIYYRTYSTNGNNEDNAWDSTSLKTTGYILCGSYSFKDSASIDNFLINMANLPFLSPGESYKLINITGGANRTSASDAAVAAIKAKVDINNVQFGIIKINCVEQ